MTDSITFSYNKFYSHVSLHKYRTLRFVSNVLRSLSSNFNCAVTFLMNSIEYTLTSSTLMT